VIPPLDRRLAARRLTCTCTEPKSEVTHVVHPPASGHRALGYVCCPLQNCRSEKRHCGSELSTRVRVLRGVHFGRHSTLYAMII
jgi:hypothetical protein